MENTTNEKKTVIYQAICGRYTHLLRLKSPVTCDQNIQKHGENLGSKLTNHKMTKFPKRSEV